MDYCKNAEELRNVLEASKALSPAADAVGREIVSALRGGGKILTCGNGGSAADALHMSEEFVGRFSRERRSLPAVHPEARVADSAEELGDIILGE